jgi:hypothetical protein
VIAILILLVCGTATAVGASRYGKRIGKKSDHGSFAAATASGVAQKPKRVYVRVKTKPRHSFKLFWAVTCSRGSTTKSKQGNFSGTGSRIKKIGLAVRKPDFCGVGASGSITGTGRITVLIYNKKRK